MSSLEVIKSAIERIILDPRYQDVLSVVKGARNGAVYGSKVRFPHALVMIFLFRSGTFRHKLSLVLRATKTHAMNLATFATIYKLTVMMLKKFGPTPDKEGPYDTFLAGLVGGYVVFGRRSPRTGKIPRSTSRSSQISHYAWPAFASLSWAMVMYLFRWHPEDLQSSLRGSMNYIYVDSNHWDSLRNFIWHNK
ncbi:unnamed protein product [Parascedosporium putredinis]|uniref:Peroxisomal membrane protein 4 n=1 Tax=Parascedosporium putredinis TaxID=1442378 RepID=A0A9P1MDA2_9PEZI|nr:unnamed protein product [Parascedosporium putredinis]CAI7999306.1 unnamed protein product [Parascedosporium putredinis]